MPAQAAGAGLPNKIGGGGKKGVPPQNGSKRSSMRWVLIIGIILYLYQVGLISVKGPIKDISYGNFYRMLEGAGGVDVVSASKVGSMIRGELSDGTKYFVNVPVYDPELLSLLRSNVSNFEVRQPKTFFATLIISLGPMILFISFLWFFVYRGAMQAGGRLMAFGRSRAQEIPADKMKVTFKDVAGVDEAKIELQEVIEFLKEPKKFQKLGGKIPKGVLLIGPPGCGKTMLAKAVSTEAGVPFFMISGSDFVEMFVGVGASRVRDLFEQAKHSAKEMGKGAIIFIDEIDAVGGQRFPGMGGHNEREQTLNALLVEMDGFNTDTGVILVAATNRPDVLDQALLRPGRFDRQIVVDRPDIIGRENILEVHVRNLKLDEGVDLKSIARQTPGFSGADIANLTNEAALLAARHNKQSIGMKELEDAIERVMAGPERKSRLISEREKDIVASHESGHALLSLLIPDVDPLHKVSIIPRGPMALGYTMQVPLEDRYIITRPELLGRLTVLLGGRAAEELVFNEISTGAQNDIEIATDIARKMVCRFGMSENMGYLTFGRNSQNIFLGGDFMQEKNYSDETALLIDKEVKRIIDESYARAKKELETHREQLDKLIKELKEREVLDDDEVKKIVGIGS